jgi:hypothetical protein
MNWITTAALSILGLGVLAPTPATAQKGDRTRLLPEEIATKPEVKNVYDAIKVLRPNFLRVRARGDNADNSTPSGYGSKSERPEPALFIDETRYERLDDLRNLMVTELAEVRLLSESETSVRFGPGHPYGALMVTTNRRK